MNLDDNQNKSSKESMEVANNQHRNYDKSPLIKKTIGGVLIKASPINYEQLDKSINNMESLPNNKK